MRGLILAQIAQGGYDLEEMINRINLFCASGEIALEDRDELIAQARAHAVEARRDDPEILALWTAVRALQADVEQLKGGKPEKADAWPEFRQPTGAHDAYSSGSCVAYSGKHYRSLIDNNVWSPDVYPQGWEEAE